MRNPVIDIAAMVPVTDIPDWCYHEAGLPFDRETRKLGSAMPTEVYEMMRDASPISKVSAVRAPTMVSIVTHSDI